MLLDSSAEADQNRVEQVESLAASGATENSMRSQRESPRGGHVEGRKRRMTSKMRSLRACTEDAKKMAQ